MAQSNPQQPDISQYPNIAANQGKYLQPNQPAQIATDQVPDAPVQPQTMQVQGPANPNEGSYENLPQHVVTAVTQMVTKPVTAIAKGMRDFIGYAQDKPNGTQDAKQPLYDTSGNLTEYGKNVDNQKINDPLGRFIIGLDASNKAEDQQAYQNPLPHTVLGQGAQGIINVAPDIGTAALLPEAEGGEALSVFQKLKTAVWNPFTKVMIAKGGLEGYSSAEQKGATPGEAAKEAGKGAVIGGVNGATAGILGGIGGKLSESGMKTLIDVGLVKSNGAITKAALDAASDAAVFGAYPVATAYAQGKKVDWDEVKSNLGMGLAFGGMKANETIGKDAELNNNIREVLNDRQAVAIQNFLNADPASIKAAYESKTSVGDTNAKAIEYAHQAQQEVDAEKKNQYVLAASTLAKTSDVKGVTETILHDKDGFLSHIEQSDLPVDMKQQITDKVNLIHGQLDQYEQVKTQAAQDIAANQQQIEQMQPVVADPAIQADPIRKTEAEVAIEKLNAKKDELFKKLKGAVSDQYDQHAENKIPVDNVPVQLPPSANVPEEENEFKNSKIQQTVYHGSDERNKVFRPTDKGIYFSEDKDYWPNKKYIYSAKINAENPEYGNTSFINQKPENNDSMVWTKKDALDFFKDDEANATPEGKQKLERLKKLKDTYEAVVFHPDQIHVTGIEERQPIEPNKVPVQEISKKFLGKNITYTGEDGQETKADIVRVNKDNFELSDGNKVAFDSGKLSDKDLSSLNKIINSSSKQPSAPLDEATNKTVDETTATLKSTTKAGKISEALQNKQIAKENFDSEGYNKWTQVHNKLSGEDNPTVDESGFDGLNEVPKEVQAAVDAKAKELRNKNNATNKQLKAQKMDMIDQMQEVHDALNGDNENTEAVEKAGYEVDDQGRVVFNVKDDGVFKIHKDFLVDNDAIDEVKKEFPEKVQNASTSKTVSTPKRSTEKQLAENRPDLESTENRLQDAKDNLAEANRLKDEKMAKVWQAEFDREQKVYDIAKNIDYKPKEENKNAISEQKTGKVGVREPSAMGEGVGEQNESGKSAGEGAQPGKEVQSNGEEETAAVGRQPAGEHGIKATGEQLDVPALKDSPYKLAATELPNGKHGVFETESGKRISKLYDTSEELLKNFEANKDKLTPEAIEAKINAENIKEGIKELPSEDVTFANDQLEPDGITLNDIKDYEQSIAERSEGNKPERTLPVDNAETVQKPETEPATGAAEDTGGKGVQESGVSKEQELKDKVADAKKRLSASLKKDRSTLKSGSPISAESLKTAIELVNAYTDVGVYKFREMVKDWIDTFGKENFTDEDADALKAAYAAHTAGLDAKERKAYNTIDELDDFMESGLKKLTGKEPVATLPKRTVHEGDRLPVDKPLPEDKEAKANYSTLGRLKDIRVRNLEQLKQFAKDIGDMEPFREVRKAATSKSQSSILLKTATDKIVGLVGKDGWKVLRESLLESRLQGAKQRWNSFATEVENYTDSQLDEMFKNGKNGQMYDLVNNLDGLEGEENPAQFAQSLITNGNYDDARNYLSDVFGQAADKVLTLGKLSNGKTLAEQVTDGKFNDPKMQQALEAYKTLLEKPLTESHQSNDGILSTANGPLDTYYPAIPTGDDQHFAAASKPFRAPDNINNKFMTGHSENYTTEIADLSNALTKSIKTNNKATALESLEKAGLIKSVPHNEKETGTMDINGERFEAVKEKIAEGRTIINENGDIIHTPSRYVAMPKWLSKELKPVFEANTEFDKFSAFGRVNNYLVKYMLGGPIEATAHSMRLLSGITNSMPFMQEWAYKNGVLGKAGGMIANNPFVKSMVGIGKIVNTDISSDKALQTIQQMSKLGIIPEKTWTKTWSKEFAELMNANKVPIWDFSPILYGKRSIDLKARVTMYNLAKSMAPDASPEQHVKMQQELGVYTNALQGELDKFVKQHGFAPFYSFSSAIYRAGLKAVTGSSPLPLERPSLKEAVTTSTGAYQASKLVSYKVAQLLSSGLIGASAYWATTYHAMTDKWPWEDKHSKLGRIPFPEAAKNDVTKKMWFNEKTGEWDDIDFFAYANQYLTRGTKALGLPKAYETAMLGGSPGQDAEAGFLQATNTALSPYTANPVAQMGTTALTGDAPYMTSLRDDKGKPSVGLFRKVRTLPLGTQQLGNAEVAMQTSNPFVDWAADKATNIFGLKSLKSNYDPNQQGAMSAFKFATDIVFPRITLPHGNDEMKEYYIEKAQEKTQEQVDKEAGN